MVLFFYPAAMTPGCTKEACHFRDLAGEFADLGAIRVGISTDAVDKQAKFSDSQRFDYPLLSDEDGKAAQAFESNAACWASSCRSNALPSSSTRIAPFWT